MVKRIDSIDIVRGFAVLQMVFWQTYDFFARTDIYATTDPLFFKPFNSPINGLGLAVFAFISGTSLFFAVKKRQNLSKKEIILHSVKRYGLYIILSLFFTSFVFGFDVFFRWGEAIQGIGFAAIIATLVLLLFKSKWIYLSLGFLITFVQPTIRHLVPPINTPVSAPLNSLISLFLNMTIRGYFSLTHVLPIMLFGIFLAITINELKSKKKIIKISALYVFLLGILGLTFHFLIRNIDVYEWTSAYQLFYTSISIFLFLISELILLKFGKIRITKFLSVFGKTPLIAYLGHFLLIKKPLDVLHLANLLGIGISLLLSLVFVTLMYYVSKLWLSIKSRQ